MLRKVFVVNAMDTSAGVLKVKVIQVLKFGSDITNIKSVVSYGTSCTALLDTWL